MSTRLTRLSLAALCATVGLALAVATPARAITPPPASAPADRAEALKERLTEGFALMRRKDFAGALSAYDEVIAGFEQLNAKPGTTYYCAGTQEEAVAYAGLGAESGKPTEVVEFTWCHAHFLRGFALVEMDRTDDARRALETAVAMAPLNAQYLSELGHVQGEMKEWQASLATFERAADAAALFAPETARAKAVSRAWRGMGFAYIELGRLDEAEEMYAKCLKADSTDEVAAHELEYVRGLRAKAKTVDKH